MEITGVAYAALAFGGATLGDAEPAVQDDYEFDGSAILFVRHRAPGRRPYNFITYREAQPVAFGPNNRDYFPQIPELGTWRPRLVSDWLDFVSACARTGRWRPPLGGNGETLPDADPALGAGTKAHLYSALKADVPQERRKSQEIVGVAAITIYLVYWLTAGCQTIGDKVTWSI